jgi:hypothetical protein
MDSREKSSQTASKAGAALHKSTSNNGGGSGSLCHGALSEAENTGRQNFPAAQQEVSSAFLNRGPESSFSRGELWIRRVSIALFVGVCVWVGLFLIVLPWTHIWTDNSLLIRNLTLRSLVLQNFVRGLVSGLGVVNIWMGIWEAVQYRDPKKESG